MKIQYCSDLHLEFPENKEFLKLNPLQPKADILLLGGDILPFYTMNKHNDFFDYVSENFEFTYWIPGNHEYYHYDLIKKSGTLKEKIRRNVFLVNNVSVQHEYVKLIFSTLWSKISPAYEWQIEKSISDFHVIKYKGYRFSSFQFNQLHEESLNFLMLELNCGFQGKIVVLSHHVPTFLNYPEKYKGDVINEAFAVELFDLISNNGPYCWIYGHHHFNVKPFRIGNTVLYTNQLGYVRNNEHKDFCPDSNIEINNFDNQYDKVNFVH